MGAKIDYVAVLKPLEIIGDDEEISVEKRLKMLMTAIKEILREAERT